MILGIDIGVQGALALLTPEGDLIEVVDLPTLLDGPAGRRAVNAPLLAVLVFKSAGGGS
jgi:crossover junction endodeoxyribonuclease RuvC